MKYVWITVLSLWISLSTREVLAQEELDDYTKCGVYEISGVIRKGSPGPVLKVKEGLPQEVVLSLDKDLGEVATIYLDKPVSVTGKILVPVNKSRGQLESTKSAKEIADMRAKGKDYSERFIRNDFKDRDPDPLHPEMDSGFKLEEKLNCRKK